MRERAVEALKEVLDPDIGVNIVDLGLVERLTVDEAGIDLQLIMTSPACPQSDYLAAESRRALERQFAGVALSVRTLATPLWTPERMSEAARRQLGWKE